MKTYEDNVAEYEALVARIEEFNRRHDMTFALQPMPPRIGFEGGEFQLVVARTDRRGQIRWVGNWPATMDAWNSFLDGFDAKGAPA
jgi:hypothetical protein